MTVVIQKVVIDRAICVEVMVREGEPDILITAGSREHTSLGQLEFAFIDNKVKARQPLDHVEASHIHGVIVIPHGGGDPCLIEIVPMDRRNIGFRVRRLGAAIRIPVVPGLASERVEIRIAVGVRGIVPAMQVD